jgi:hypothetical protein
MFRDENETVLRKAHKNTVVSLENLRLESPIQNTIPETQPMTTLSPTPTPTSWEIPEWNLEPQTLLAHRTSRQISPTPDEDKGITFFFDHYVMILSHSTGEKINYKTTTFWPHLWTNRLFFNAVCSVGLAALSNVTKDEAMMVAARQKYLELMKYVAAALKNLDEVDLEDTLKAVMMLAIFEVCSMRLSSMGMLSLNRSLIALRQRQESGVFTLMALQTCCGSSRGNQSRTSQAIGCICSCVSQL